MFIKPWDEKSKRILEQLIKDKVTYIGDPDITRRFGRMYPELFDEKTGFADIGNIWKRKESMLVLRPGSGIMPIRGKDKYRFFKIF